MNLGLAISSKIWDNYIMTIKKNQLEISDFFGQNLSQGNFALAQRILRIRDQAESIHEVATNRVNEDGEFAKLFAESITEWVGEILTDANATLNAHLDTNSKEK